ncbi:MAG TPA: aminotransferase class III-fold pyridoxal phosphate-dependent enzyme, partial [Bryobacteraceae bacterium]|nr:aminotransferase class III-fold pyridoxal phosphate-dependent enzyme [Bryobacteraceae bacterium]
MHAEQLARDLYSLDATATRLNGEYDLNFHLKTSDGREFALKIMRPDCERAFVEMQIAALQHLRDLPVPRVAGEIRQTPDGRLAWLLDWIPGKLWADSGTPPGKTLEALGGLIGRLDAALAGFDHPAAHRELKWDLSRAAWIRDHTHHIADPNRRTLVERVIASMPDVHSVPWTVIHGDINDHNIVVSHGEISGFIDFGDLHYGPRVADLAVACTYACFGHDDPLAAIQHVIRGFEQTCPLTHEELSLVFPLILTRLAVSVTNSAHLKSQDPDNRYASVSETHAWAALEKLMPANILEGVDLRTQPSLVLDLSVGSPLLGASPKNVEPEAMTEIVWREMKRAHVRVGVGRYNEARAWYTEPAFGGGHPTEEHRTIHLGLDLFADPGTPICAPLEGTVHLFGNNDKRLDYGPVIVLKHSGDFYTLYGHLALDSLDGLEIGQRIDKGRRFAKIGDRPGNGDWAPHLHFQIINDLQDLGLDFPGVAYAGERDKWLKLSPDPNQFIGVPKLAARSVNLGTQREQLLGPNLSISYDQPLNIVRGWKQYLYDETGRAYLDCYNNVPLVGHSHPKVVEAVERQMALLNTNTRYLHQTILEYASTLTRRFPEPLSVCYFLNSASEANELALRLARTFTGREDVIVLDHAYHGHTNTLIDISPYKFNGPGGRGKKPWVHVAPLPDPLRRDDPTAGREYAAYVARILEHASPAAFIAESLPSVGGQVVFPPGYLAECYRHVHAAGGLSIADEVQAGFGRLGRWMWGFEMQGVVPDIAVLGKPMGNAFPLAGVVTTREIAQAFDNGMEFFSTFGGNPVACAAGRAVLEVLDEERLQENAKIVGDHWMDSLRRLKSDHPRAHSCIRDVRGAGLFL